MFVMIFVFFKRLVQGFLLGLHLSEEGGKRRGGGGKGGGGGEEGAW